MKELVCNLHIHSTYSDGSGTYPEITAAALKSGVDVIILTDHNVLVKGLEGYHSGLGRNVLVLTGEEVHDQNRDPQKCHTLVIGCAEEMAGFAEGPQNLIDAVNKAGGLSFLAHPNEFALPMIHEPDISWVDWDVRDFTGLELWNGMSEFKTVTHSVVEGLYYLFMPELMAHGPLQTTLDKWDEILSGGQRVVVVGGSDAHAIKFERSILKRTVYPYEFHFSAINNHLLIHDELTGEVDHDKTLVYQALRNGSSFIGYDLPAATHGFSFTVENDSGVYSMGETVEIDQGATVRVSLPTPANIRLINNGSIIAEQSNSARLTCAITEPGYYRVECTLFFINKQRGWIYSNPVYVVKNLKRKIF